MQDAGIIRNSLKIKGTVANAIAFMEVQKSSAVSPNTSGDS
jgi:DNA-3-methyladenine glycosylase I